MLRNYIKHIFYITFIIVLSFAVFSAQEASAQANTTTVFCPAGYTCKPIASICPEGYICTPITKKIDCPKDYVCEAVNTDSTIKNTACYKFSAHMTIGSTGADVVALQKFLIENGFLVLPTDTILGSYSALTRLAVIRYQTAVGLPTVGIVGPLTMRKLNMSCGGATSTTIDSSNSRIKMSWSNGKEKVNIGLVDNRFEKDGTILGWIMLDQKTSGSFVWNGQSITDLLGKTAWKPLSVSTGPFRIIAVSAGQTGNYCMSSQSDCSYVLSLTSFTIGANRSYDLILPSFPISTKASKILMSDTPSITSVNPTYGFAGTSVTLTGTGFDANVKGGIGLSVTGKAYGTNVAINYISPTRITATLPSDMNNGTYYLSIEGGNFITDTRGVSFIVTGATPTPVIVTTPPKESLLTTSCYSTPSSPKIGDKVTWQLVQSGGASPYTYSWTGSDGLVGNMNGYAYKAYTTGGIKTATLTVKTPQQSVTANCSVNVISSASNVNNSVSPINPTITVTYPKGGEALYFGNKLPIKWSYTGFEGFTTEHVDVYLVPQDGRTALQVATNFAYSSNNNINLSLDKSIKLTTGSYKVKVMCQPDNSAGFRACSDMSDTAFTIMDAPSPSPSPASSGGY